MFRHPWLWTTAAAMMLAQGCGDTRSNLDTLLTRAEATEFRETSSSAEVVEFISAVANASRRVRTKEFGTTNQGRPLYLAVFGDVSDATPEAVLGANRLRVLITANIHAGEVDGKEAMLMLLRSLAEGEKRHWADSLVLVVVPDFNPDGNEAMALTNRGRQHGPIAGVGTRTNAQGLNLNRDFIKLEAPETRALIGVFNAYDPHIYIDLHATNGTRIAYHLTYAPPQHPNTDSAIVVLLRGDLLPQVTNRIREKYGWEFFYYGNLSAGGPDREQRWQSFGHLPRFSTNYAGLRNRLGILSESYAYATFEERILASKRFLEEIMEYAYGNARAVRQAVELADGRPLAGTRLALSAVPYGAGQVEVLLGEVVEELNPLSGQMMLRRTDARRPVMALDYGHYAPRETELVPVAYLVPAELDIVLDKLHAHGIRTQLIAEPRPLPLERFRITSSSAAARPSEGRVARSVMGEWESAQVGVPAGSHIVPVDQPLGRLVFYLLEPRSDDGLLYWGFLDEAIAEQEHYPIYRVIAGPAGSH